MLKFFLADIVGLCFFVLFAGSSVLLLKQQWLYGALGLLLCALYLAAGIVYGTTHK